MAQAVRDLGEQGLLQLFRPFCCDLVGDDAAIMGALLPGYELVVTTDILIDGVHFSGATTSPQDAGWRAAAANLSDLAAMGAIPWGVVMAVGLPPDTPVAWITGVYEGLTECLSRYGTKLVGGDTVRSPVATLSITAFGQVQCDRVIYRHTAQIGDAILITGAHGLSKAGLELLLHPDLGANLSAEAISCLHNAHQRPQPRLDVPPAIWQFCDRASGMDSSDGLADAIAQICKASHVGARIDWSAIPIPEAIKAIAADRAIDWVLYGGEDFELVLCLPNHAAQALTTLFPSAKIIGEIIAGSEIEGLDRAHSFQHF
jgi:thiamine-monophosphate kinase